MVLRLLKEASQGTVLAGGQERNWSSSVSDNPTVCPGKAANSGRRLNLTTVQFFGCPKCFVCNILFVILSATLLRCQYDNLHIAVEGG